MPLPLNPEILRAAYDYLRTTLPFCNWNLPDGEDVRFKVTQSAKFLGECVIFPDKKRDPLINISARYIGRTETLMETMAHEMIHLYQGETKMWKRAGREHDAAFYTIAEQVCKIHGFDPKTF